MKKNRLQFVMMLVILVTTGMNLFAQDWPQWRGAQRDGVLKKADINLDWTAKKPPLAWTFNQAGSGYSAPTIAGTTLYVLGGADGKDFAIAIDVQTGKQKWKQDLGDLFVEARGNGGYGSITVDGDKLYFIRSGGQIHCLSATDGKMIWQKDFIKDLGGRRMANWGFSESPLVDGNLVICTPGGDAGTIIALDKNTGNTVWRSKEWTDPSGYSSVIVAEVDGIRQYIQHANKGVAGVSAKDGKLLWKVDNPTYSAGRGASAVIPTPIFQDNIVYITNGYNCGNMGIKLTREGDNIKAESIYANRNLENQHGGVVLINGYIYGHSERASTPGDSWVCQNFKNGEIVWSKSTQEAGIGKGSIIGVNDRLICFDMQRGTVAVIAASPDGWKEFGRIEIPERTTIQTMDNHLWTHPVIANDKLFIRDHDLLFCFDLKK